MNGVHDLGGMHGFGPVRREENEPWFHADWEKHVFAIRRATMAQGLYNLDEFRHGIERMDPAHYLASSYYEHWLASVETLLIEKGVVTKEELDARTAFFREHPAAALPEREDPALVDRVLAGGPVIGVAQPQRVTRCRFQVGDRVVTRNIHPKGHTRLPRYARGKRGVITRIHGLLPLPDANAHGLGEQPQPVYSVRFESTELWGDAAEPHTSVYLDLWEGYLEPAGAD